MYCFIGILFSIALTTFELIFPVTWGFLSYP